MSLFKDSSIIPSTRKEMIYQEALRTLEESRQKQSQASLLILRLNQRMVGWGVITIVSSIIFFLTLYSYCQKSCLL